jgi:colanic acid/amylovoran biosynthesis protein
LFFCSLYSLLKKIGINIKFTLPEKYLCEYLISDIIVDLSGDSFSDSKGGRSIINIMGILIGIILEKPIVFFSQSIGPFNKWTLPLSLFCLNKATMIIVRENITKEYLFKIGVTSPIYLTADCAFVLDSVSSEIVDNILLKEGIAINRRPLIGVSANIMLDDKENHYALTMAKLIEYLVQNLNAQVIFIPHVISIKEGGLTDDREMAKKIYELIENKTDVDLIKGDYSPEELKGIIKLFDLFIGGRMHANIAALSSNIPTLATSWSHKYYGIMSTLGQEKYVCDFKTMDLEELKLKVDELWANRFNVKAELQQKVEIQKKMAVYSGELVSKVITYSQN